MSRPMLSIRSEGPPHKAWYKTARWQRVRMHQLQSEPLCKFCKDDGDIRPATICDHVEPHKGDEQRFWSGPFQSLCEHHHNSDKQRIERGGKRKPKIGLSGWPE